LVIWIIFFWVWLFFGVFSFVLLIINNLFLFDIINLFLLIISIGLLLLLVFIFILNIRFLIKHFFISNFLNSYLILVILKLLHFPLVFGIVVLINLSFDDSFLLDSSTKNTSTFQSLWFSIFEYFQNLVDTVWELLDFIRSAFSFLNVVFQILDDFDLFVINIFASIFG